MGSRNLTITKFMITYFNTYRSVLIQTCNLCLCIRNTRVRDEMIQYIFYSADQ